jgi:hypothetical protein
MNGDMENRKEDDHKSLDDDVAASSIDVGPNAQDPMTSLLGGLSMEELATMEKKMVRRMDIRIMPVIILLYVLNYLDRNSISAARLQGLQSDLNMTDVQYQTCLSILYLANPK